MAENDLLQGGNNSRSSNPDWDDNQNRFDREREIGQQRTNYGSPNHEETSSRVRSHQPLSLSRRPILRFSEL